MFNKDLDEDNEESETSNKKISQNNAVKNGTCKQNAFKKYMNGKRKHP
jgi:hypothetical protein